MACKVKCKCGASEKTFKKLMPGEIDAFDCGDCDSNLKKREKEAKKASQKPALEKEPEMTIPADMKLEETDELPEEAEVTENVVMAEEPEAEAKGSKEKKQRKPRASKKNSTKKQ